MWVKRALTLGILVGTLVLAPYVVAETIPTTKTEAQIVSAPTIDFYLSAEKSTEIKEDLSRLRYVADFPEYTPNATQLLGTVDCGSYAIAVASKIYDLGYNPYVLYLEFNNGSKTKEHWVVIYNNGNGWGSIGGKEWDTKEPIYLTIDQLVKSISRDYNLNEYFVFQFSPEVYEGYKKIEVK